MSSDEDEVNVELNIPITIGRRQCKLVTPSPVYRLQRKDNKPETNVSVTFKREVIGGNNERLVAEIDGVKCGSANSAYELAVSPYPEEDENGNNNDFWMESGLLAVYENG